MKRTLLVVFLIFALAVVVLAAWVAYEPNTPVTPGSFHARVEHRLFHPERLWTASFSPDSQLLATSCLDGNARIWRVADGSLLRSLHHPAGVIWAAFSPDGQTIATSSYDSVVRQWNVADGALLREFRGHTDVV